MTTTTFAYTGGAQSFTVPAGISLLTAELWGGQGGAGASGDGGDGGLGGYLKATLTVTPGETLTLYVGGTPTAVNVGGYNGGGSCGYYGPGIYCGGGGASDVRRGGTALTNRVAVGGGGGGADSGSIGSSGGVGGGTTGSSSGGSGGGTGGTQSVGGTGGGDPGTLGVGGVGGVDGGGGGGGYYGGGGGAPAGGGGGSSYSSGTILTNTQGVQFGSGQIIITVNVAPNAPTLNTPATGTTIDRAVTNRLGFTPSDPDAGDSQSKFDLQYKLVSAGAWTTITQPVPNSYWDAVGGTFAAGDHEWQTRTYDSQGLVGPWSVSSFFTAAGGPATPTITAPTNGATIGVTETVTWSAPNQTDYQLRHVADLAGAPDPTTVYYDSGDVVDGVTRSVSVAFPVNNRWEHVQVRIRYAGLWSSWADVRVQVSWTAPMVPTLTATAFSQDASIDVVITNPAPTGGEPAVVSNDVFVSSPLDPEYRAATLVAPNSTWTWKTPAAGRVYTVRVVAVGSNGTTSTSA